LASLTKERRKNPTTGKLADYWKVAYREGTSQRREALGFLDEKDAARAFEQWKARRVLGLATAPATAPSSSLDAGPTLREWWGHEDEAWPPPTPRRMYDWVMAQGRADKTVQSANSARRAFLPLFGDKPLRAVTNTYVHTSSVSKRDFVNLIYDYPNAYKAVKTWTLFKEMAIYMMRESRNIRKEAGRLELDKQRRVVQQRESQSLAAANASTAITTCRSGGPSTRRGAPSTRLMGKLEA
jgi:hypothetical protein